MHAKRNDIQSIIGKSILIPDRYIRTQQVSTRHHIYYVATVPSGAGRALRDDRVAEGPG